MIPVRVRRRCHFPPRLTVFSQDIAACLPALDRDLPAPSNPQAFQAFWYVAGVCFVDGHAH